MKTLSTLILVLALVALVSTCVAFTPTSGDMAWKNATIKDMALTKSDTDNINKAQSDKNNVAMAKFADQLGLDAANALRKSQASSVSPELQNAKNYYEQSLAMFQSGAYKVSAGVNDAIVRKGGMADIIKGKDYMKRASQELETVAG